MTDTTTAAASPAASAQDALEETFRARGLSLHGTLLERMGIEILEATPEHLVGTMPVAGNTQPAGLLHGGAHLVLAESLGSIGAVLHAGPGANAVGIEINATHTRAITEGLVTGTATALHLGRTLATYEVVMTDEQGRRLSTARITNMIVRKG